MQAYKRIVALFLAVLMLLGPEWPNFVQSLYAQPVSVNPPRTSIGLKPLVDQLLAATSDTTDTDEDGLPDSVEIIIGTDPNSADSDFDKLTDLWEIDSDLDPMAPDSNFDGMPDYLEVTDVPSMDIDGDGIPNAWDYDNDGDGVNDTADLSPSAKTELQDQFHFDITTDGNPAYITIQVKPSHPEYLRLYGRAWDWPDNDHEGAVQDWDNSKEDIFILPILEVTANAVPDLAEVVVNGIAVEGNTLSVPLMPMNEHGSVVAYGARIPYPTSTPENLTLDARLIWKVVGIIDPNATDLNQNTVLATYNDSFSITGMIVEESIGTDVGIFYSSDLNQTVAANLVMAWQFLRNSDNHLADMPAILDANNIDVDLQLATFANRDSALADLANQMIPDALESLPADVNLPIITLMEDSSATLDLSEFTASEPNSFTIDVAAQPFMTTKSLKTNWYNTSTKQNMETGDIMAEIQNMGQSQETTYSLMSLMLYWNTGVQALEGLGIPQTDPGDDFELVPDVAEKIAGGIMSGLEILYRSKVGLAGLDALRSLKLLQAKGWSIALGSTDLTKLGNFGKFKLWLRQCDNITDSTKMFKKLSKVCDVLDVIAIGIDVGFAIYSFIAIAQSNDLSGIALAGANMMVAFELIYSFILLGISLIPYVGWIIALVIELSDIIGDWSEDFFEWLVDCFTNVDYVPTLDVDVVGDPSFTIDDKDFNGTDVGDRIEYRSRLKSTVTATSSYWSLVQKSYIDPYYKLYAPAGSSSATGYPYTMNLHNVNLPVTDKQEVLNYTEGWKTVEYESGAWLEPGTGMPNFPVYVELNSNYQNWYAWSWWLFGWWHEEDYEGGTSILGGFTIYCDILPATLADFVQWRGIASLDNDGDGLKNSEETGGAWWEFDYISNPWMHDTDSDGLSDKFEVDNGLNPRAYDTDRDGLIDWYEVQYGIDAVNDDTDGDGITDYLEIAGWLIEFEYAGQTFTTRVFSDPTIPDTDSDGVNDYLEYWSGLNPRSQDTNGDGIRDIARSQEPEGTVEFVKRADFDFEYSGAINDIAVDADGFVYAMLKNYNDNLQIKKFDTDLNEVSTWTYADNPQYGFNPNIFVDNMTRQLYITNVYDPTPATWQDDVRSNVFAISLIDGSEVGYWATRDEIEGPWELALERVNDNIYVGRSGAWLHWDDYSWGIHSFIDIYDTNRNRIGSWGDYAWEPEQRIDRFAYIKDIAYNPTNDLLYICDQGIDLTMVFAGPRFRPDRIAVFTPDGQYLNDLPGYHKDGEDYDYYYLSSVDIDSEGFVYICDEGNYRIHKLDSNGMSILSWGGQGTGDGQFVRGPIRAVVDTDKNVFVLVPPEAEGDRWHYISKFSQDMTDPNEPIIVPETNPDRDDDGLLNDAETAGWDITFTDPNGSQTIAVTSDPLIADTDLDGLTDYQEYQIGTNPRDPDTDHDGLGDFTEAQSQNSPSSFAPLARQAAAQVQTDPRHFDSDNDGLSDGAEAIFGSNPNKPDTDDDGLSDAQEFALGTDPNNPDTDGDGLSDGDEAAHNTNPLSPDTDGDFVFDGHEANLGTDPNNSDMDDDGLPDGMEVVVHNTDPENGDSDGDGLNDGTEVDMRLNPNIEDTDGDGIPDGEELDNGTNPSSKDSDHDGIPDGQDIAGNLAPDISNAYPSQEYLWPANNKFVPITIEGVTDSEGDPFLIGIESVTCDEASALASRNKDDDAYLDDDGTLYLKAERDGRGNGRVYEITFVAVDDKGEYARGKVQVKVPHSKRKDVYKCIDDGQQYVILSYIPNQAPDISAAYLSQQTLSPADLKFKRINILGITDPDGDNVKITITNITSDEPVAFSLLDIYRPDAWIQKKTNTVFLRAECNPKGNGRVYEIFFTARDARGNTTNGSLKVNVPVGESELCIDDGQQYNTLNSNWRDTGIY